MDGTWDGNNKTKDGERVRVNPDSAPHLYCVSLHEPVGKPRTAAVVELSSEGVSLCLCTLELP